MPARKTEGSRVDPEIKVSYFCLRGVVPKKYLFKFEPSITSLLILVVLWVGSPYNGVIRTRNTRTVETRDLQ